MTRLRRLILIATLATHLLIIVGASVRASGAGLGCPDWPKCFGVWIPPTSAEDLPEGFDPEAFNAQKTWIEYFNRLVGVTVGFLILGATIAAVRAWRRGEASRLIAFEMIAAVLLTGGQAWLGGLVVKKGLDPRFVTVHLVLAIVILGLLVHALWLCYQAGRTPKGPQESSDIRAQARRALTITLGTLTLITTQIVLGAVVRGTLDVVASEDPLLPRGDRLAEVGFADWLHRKIALVSFVFALAASWMTKNLPAWHRSRMLRRSTYASLLLLAGQIAVGLTLAYAALPPVAQVAHIALASALWCTLFLQALSIPTPIAKAPAA